MKLTELASLLGTEVAVGKTVHGGRYAALDGVEIMDNGFLRSAVGFGQTAKEARQALVIALRGMRVAKDAYQPTRFEVEVPVTLKV